MLLTGAHLTLGPLACPLADYLLSSDANCRWRAVVYDGSIAFFPGLMFFRSHVVINGIERVAGALAGQPQVHSRFAAVAAYLKYRSRAGDLFRGRVQSLSLIHGEKALNSVDIQW